MRLLKKVFISISVRTFLKYLNLLRVCVHVSVLNKGQREMRVRVFSLRTSGSGYSPCDLCVVLLHPSPHRSSVGEQSNDWVLLGLCCCSSQDPRQYGCSLLCSRPGMASCWPACCFFPHLSLQGEVLLRRTSGARYMYVILRKSPVTLIRAMMAFSDITVGQFFDTISIIGLPCGGLLIINLT